MRAGDRLQGAREIAKEFDVDVRTALRACQVLESEGLIETRRRSGMYVAFPTSPSCSLSPVQETVVDLLALALEEGIRPSELQRTIDATYYSGRVRVACIESNADHAQAIAAMAAETFGVEAVPTDADEVLECSLSNPPSSTAIFLTTAFLAAAVRRAAEPLGCPVFVATMDASQGIEVMRSIADRAICVIGIDRRWAERGAAALERTQIGANLRLFVLGEDNIDDIPLDAEIFATPAAARAAASLPIAGRVRVLRYHLEASEARGFIAAIVAELARKRGASINAS
jgi:DNA-binding transcriptional regulator YhcF (GntR family)